VTGHALDEPTQRLYRVPLGPAAGWTSAPSPRRTRVSRAILLVLLVVQAAMSLRLRNTAFEDEALYLYAGHLELDHLIHGGPSHPEFLTYFSGSPLLYPVLGAAVDSVLGLAGARGVGLACMLGATALLYSLTRMLFNERVGLCAAAVFAVAQSTLFLGNFATYDPPAVLLLALAGWLAVRTARGGTLLASMLTAPAIALAIAVKYASGLYLPTVTVLAVLAAYPYRGRWALGRGLGIPALVAALLGAALLAGGRSHLAGLTSTTTRRASGTNGPLELLLDSVRWGGPLFVLAVLGTVLYVRRERMGELPAASVAATRAEVRSRSPAGRLLLGGLLSGTAVLAPAYQIHLHTGTSLHKHIGFGLLFAAPMAGIGLSRLVGAHFRRPELAIVVWVTLLMLGLTQSQDRYHVWPDTTRLIATLRPQLGPDDHYLVGANWVPQYSLRGNSRPDQWTSTYSIAYTDRRGRHLSGDAGYQAAIADAYFDVLVLDPTGGGIDPTLVRQLRGDADYRLLAALPYRRDTGGAFYRVRYVSGSYQVWVRVTARPSR
jgi:hypothetical protein